MYGVELIQKVEWRVGKMTEKMFLTIFVAKNIFAFLIIVFGSWMLIKKKGVKISFRRMVECKLKNILEKNQKNINSTLNVLVCILFFIIIVGSLIPAIRDTPYIIHNNLMTFKGEVSTGSSLVSKNKIETYNIKVLNDAGEIVRLYVYGKNGIKTGDYVIVKYLPHSKEGVLIKNVGLKQVHIGLLIRV